MATISMMSEAAVGNIFSIDLYADGYETYLADDQSHDANHTHVHPDDDHSAGANHSHSSHAHRWLHEYGTLDDKEIQDINIHTTWYMQWLIFNCLYMVAFLRVLRHIYSPAPLPKWVPIGLWVGIFGAFGAACAMYLCLSEGVDWYYADDHTAVQVVLLAASTYTGASAWHWFPVVMFRSLIPKGVGVSFTLVLEGEEEKAHSKPRLARSSTGAMLLKNVKGTATFPIFPARLISVSFRLLALACIGAYLSMDPEADGETLLPLAAGFRVVPYTYLFTPFWMLFLVLFGTGVALTAASLQCNPKITDAWRLANRIVGILLCTTFSLCVLIILPQVESLFMMGGLLILFMPTWIITARGSQGPKQEPKVYAYAAVVFILGVSSPFSPLANALLLVAMLLYEYVIPESSDVLYVTIQALTPKRLLKSAATISPGADEPELEEEINLPLERARRRSLAMLPK